MKRHIRTGDEVQVVSGAESGRRTPPPEGDSTANPQGVRGRVRRVLRPAKGHGGRVVVQGVRMVKKATRPDPRKGHRGGFIELEAPMRPAGASHGEEGRGRQEGPRVPEVRRGHMISLQERHKAACLCPAGRTGRALTEWVEGNRRG